ncbi:uncharacterized protein LOC120414013 [Culex pipiens pallens]|uniref:uncharacterized protein LOC120414013 n=1 Tax=Culex pipiens pallens TaxID=42434 RepID=UPI0022AAC911|nr:uncharacterized protein LOC120414013 [Culex pipiens pallens]
MILQLLLLYVCFRASTAGYVSVQLPYGNPAGINYVSGQSHYQAGLLAGPTRYSVPAAAHQYPVQNVQVLGTPSYYSYNLPTPVSVPANPFHGYGYGHAAFTPVSYGPSYARPSVVTVAQQQPVHPVVSYGTVARPSVVAVAHPQPVQPVVTQYHGHSVPTATVVPVHVPAVTVRPVAPIAPVAPVHTTTITKTVTEENSVYASTEQPLPVIKSRRYKVRRPAIQNQFYDIEERVIIRPVGSALVELEQPVSKTETSVRTHTVQTQSEDGVNDFGQGQGHTVTTVTQKPQVIQTHTVYHQTPVAQVPVSAYDQGQGHTVTTVTQKPQVFQTHTVYHQTPVAQVPVSAHGQGHTITTVTQKPVVQTNTVYHQTPVAQVPVSAYDQGQGHTVTTVTQKPQVFQTHNVYHQTPVAQVPVQAPKPVIVHSSTAGHVVPQAFVPQYQPIVPQYQQPFYVNQFQPVYYPTSTYPVPVTTFKPAVVTTPAPTTVIPSTTDSGNVYYDDDSVVIEARSGGRTIHVETSSEAPLEHSTAQGPLKYSRKCDDQTVDDPPKRGDIAITYATEATHQSLSDYQENSTEQPTTEQQAEATTTTVAPVRGIEITARLALGGENQSQSAQLQSNSRSANFNEVSSSTPSVIITNRGSSEQVRTNQEQFIKLLSERDSIAEVSYGPNTDSSSSLINTYVRSRVLSATPAPQNAKETSKTVNIRRIIVSRPIETEQEVEVREQSYPSHGYKRQTTSSSEQFPIYTTAKPPAFADDDNVK